MRALYPGLLLLVAICACAQAQDFRAEITPFAGYRYGGELDVAESDQAVKLKSSPAYGLLLDIYDPQGVGSFQFLYSQQRTDAEFEDPSLDRQRIDTVLHTLQFGGTYRGTRESLQPYLAATIGATHITTSGRTRESDTFASGSIGGGIHVRPIQRVDFLVEGRLHAALIDNNTNLFCQTGPDANVCAVRVSGDLLLQAEVFAGVTIRF
jgi:hypothetical protein